MGVMLKLRGTLYPSLKISKTGPTILQGNTAPTNGSDGDIWIENGSNSNLFQRINGSWISLYDVPGNHPGVRNSLYYSSPFAETSAIQNISAITNTLIALPMFLPAGITINRLGIQTISTSTGSNIRLGLYSNNNGVPGTLLADTGNISTASSSGVKEGVVSYKTTGLAFWVAFNGSYTGQLKGCNAGAWSPSAWTLGRTAAAGNTIKYLSASLTFGALPSTFPTASSYTSSEIPIIWVRSV